MKKLLEFLKWLLSIFLKQETAIPMIHEPKGAPETPEPNQGSDGWPKPKEAGIRIAISSGHRAGVPGAVWSLPDYVNIVKRPYPD